MRSGEREKALVVFDRALEIAPGEAGTRPSEVRILIDRRNAWRPSAARTKRCDA